jgi:hypothetical protein
MNQDPRSWEILGRPLGEWLFLGTLGALGANALINGATAEPAHGLAQRSVLVAQMVLGLAALGVVLATLSGRQIGLRLLWAFGAAVSYAAPTATWAFGGAPISDIVIASLGGVMLSGAMIWYGRRRLHAAITRRVWPALLAEHAEAADAFVAAISELPQAQWSAKATPEGWSPAEITEHLARTYSQYAGESRGKNSLRVRLGPVRLFFARAFVKPRLLAGAPFPKAKAPRPLRPSGGPDTPADGVALFRATGESCLRDLGILVERRPHKRLVHPYLGGLPIYDVVRFASQHIHHHRRQLLAVIAQLSTGGSARDHAS